MMGCFLRNVERCIFCINRRELMRKQILTPHVLTHGPHSPVPRNVSQPKESTQETCVQGRCHQGITMTGKELPAPHPRLPPFQKEPRIWLLSNQCPQGRPTFFFFTPIVCHWSGALQSHAIIISCVIGRHLVQENSVRI